MRIIAGTARSLPLKAPEGMDTRPTTDRIKETLFNMIQNEVPGSCFLDLFSGSGSIALEALSRGARMAVMVENSRKAAKVIQENIDFTKMGDRCSLKIMDAAAFVRGGMTDVCFDLVFMDPPYGRGFEYGVLEALKESPMIGEDTLIIIETDLETDPASYLMGGAFVIKKDKRYKTSRHVFLKKA